MASQTDQTEIIADFFTWLVRRESFPSLIEGNDKEGFAARSALLLLDASITDVSWEEVVFGRLIYESLSWGEKVVSRLIAYIESDCGVMSTSLGTDWDAFAPSLHSLHDCLSALMANSLDGTPRGTLCYNLHYAVAQMVVSVFYKRLPPPCGLSCSFGYRRCFLQGLFQINRRVDPFKELPTYKDLISRWRCACKAIVAPFSGYFGRVEGLAWNNNGEDVSNSNDRTLMSAMDAFTASAGFASL
jgi:hypothetical protein